MEQKQSLIIARTINSYEEMRDYQREQMRTPRFASLAVLISMALLQIPLAAFANWNIVRLIPGAVLLLGVPLIGYLAFDGAFYFRRQHERSSVFAARYVHFRGDGFALTAGLDSEVDEEIRYNEIDGITETKFAFYIRKKNMTYLVSKLGFHTGDEAGLRELLRQAVGVEKYRIR